MGLQPVNHWRRLAVAVALLSAVLAIGTLDDVPWMPKGRYRIMADYMPKRGSLGLDMMFRTCTVQVNLDFADEADMVATMRWGYEWDLAAAALIARDDWLPDAYAQPHPEKYRQYLLYGDPLDRFSLVSFVWGPGQRTPVHDHLMWGLIGMLFDGTAIDAVPYWVPLGEPTTLMLNVLDAARLLAA